MSKKPISLVLGSGGARGMAHIGVIRCLEERGYDIRYIAGTSIGALVGGIYAAGRLDEYADWVGQLQRSDIVRLLDFSFTRHSLFKGERIINALKELIGDHEISELPIGFTAVATALEERREVWIRTGPLFDAIRASIAVPTVFSPVMRDGRLLVDGGLVNPVPIAPTLNQPDGITVAVDLNGFSDIDRAGSDTPEPPDDDNSTGYRAAISRFIDSLMPSSDEESVPDVFDLITQAIDIMQSSIARLKLAAYSPDIVIEIPRNACSFFEFDRSREMIDLGYRRATAALEKHHS